MTTLYELRDQLKYYYAEFSTYINIFLKFILGLLVFFTINSRIGYMKALDMAAVPIILSLVGALTPINVMVILATVVVLAHFFALSMELAGVAAALLLVMLFLYFVMAPRHGYLLLLVPLLFAYKIPYVAPLVVGLIGNPICVVPAVCGIAAYYMLHFAVLNEGTLESSTDVESMGDRIKYIIDYLTGNKEMMVMILAFAAVICLVYIIRRLSIDYSWYIAIVAGGLATILISIVGIYMLSASISLVSLIVGTLVSMAVATVVQFFVFSVDYTGTRSIQFEDDEYYYYVKAVPKVVVAAKNKQVKEIHARRKTSSQGSRPKKSSQGRKEN